ncbi:MAG: ketoacyl-ACP synthase III [Thermoanaerobaculaceae bacterium]|jgi:3-oxoacyl-[acyl-carrier-protein] synthase-3|nr:ketoacyl-ACP synthase III [Thermoanaerobaculaceae bacterium]
MARYARIVSTGRFLPEREVTNDELRARFDPVVPEFVTKMEESSGIRSRYWAPDDWATSDVALPAARQALERAGRKPEEVDLIILGTDSPDYITPATSVVLQHKLGAKNAGTFDIGCACASFPTGLACAAGLLAANPSLKTVLVVGVYLMHKLASPADPMIFFYGDGAGAAVLEAAAEPGFVASAAQADGAYHRHWGIYAGGTFEPATEEAVKAGRTTVRMLERYPPEINHEGWPRLTRKLAAAGGFAVSDLDFIIFTQVRKPSIELVMGELGLSMDKTHTVMEKWGYTGSACIPMALDDAMEQGKIHPGDLVAFVGSGVGYNQAAAAFRML